MRLILILFVCLLCASSAAAQADQCKIKAADAPEVRGFKLGKTYDEVFKDLPEGAYSGVSPSKGEFGESDIDIYDIQSHAHYAGLMGAKTISDWAKRFEGVNDVGLKFLDEKLVYIKIEYDDSTKWDNPREFTTAIASSLNLPQKGWHNIGAFMTLDCDGFTVRTLNSPSRPWLMIKMSDFEDVLAKRKADAEKQKRATFKP